MKVKEAIKSACRFISFVFFMIGIVLLILIFGDPLDEALEEDC